MTRTSIRLAQKTRNDGKLNKEGLYEDSGCY